MTCIVGSNRTLAEFFSHIYPIYTHVGIDVWWLYNENFFIIRLHWFYVGTYWVLEQELYLGLLCMSSRFDKTELTSTYKKSTSDGCIVYMSSSCCSCRWAIIYVLLTAHELCHHITLAPVLWWLSYAPRLMDLYGLFELFTLWRVDAHLSLGYPWATLQIAVHEFK